MKEKQRRQQKLSDRREVSLSPSPCAFAGIG
jgi:hypothetical protein